MPAAGLCRSVFTSPLWDVRYWMPDLEKTVDKNRLLSPLLSTEKDHLKARRGQVSCVEGVSFSCVEGVNYPCACHSPAGLQKKPCHGPGKGMVSPWSGSCPCSKGPQAFEKKAPGTVSGDCRTAGLLPALSHQASPGFGHSLGRNRQIAVLPKVALAARDCGLWLSDLSP